MSIYKSIKAFTLFTALVSFIIIGIGVLVIQHMSNSEQNYSLVINSIYNQQEMDSVKDLIRIDAFQTFNVLYRAKFYDYFTSQSNLNFSAQDLGLHIDWKQFKEDYFKELYFGSGSGSKFGDFIGSSVLSILHDYSGFFRGDQYFFRIYDYSLQKNNNVDIFSSETVANLTGENIKLAFNESIKQDDFVNFLNCKDNEGDCPNGSFSTILYVNSIPYNHYLYLPRILVKRNLDNSAMDDSILTRNVISLYTPLRLFGAMAYARTELKTIDKDPLEDAKWGDNVAFDCDSITELSQIPDAKDNKIEKEKVLNDLLDEYKQYNSSNNNFDFKYVNLDALRTYVSDYSLIILPDGSIQKYNDYKLESAKVTVSVKDNDKYFSFGHDNFDMGFYGVIKVNEDPKVNINVCVCSLEGSETKFKCEGNKYPSIKHNQVSSLPISNSQAKTTITKDFSVSS